MVFGARVWKTGIAVALSLYISIWLNFSVPVIAAVAAIFAMQPSIYRSWRNFVEQLQTNILGAVLAVLAGMVFSNNVFTVGLVCILVIIICLKLHMEQAIGLTLVTVVSVMEAASDWQFALNRLLLSLIGIGCAFLINIIFFPPNPKDQFVVQIQTAFGKMSLLLRTVISNEMKETVFRQDKDSLRDTMQSLDNKYGLMKEDVNRLKRASMSRLRQLAIYKQMLHTMKKGFEALETVEEHYVQVVRSPEVDAYLDGHLERLNKFYEYVLLKHNNKMKSDVSEGLEIAEENERFMRQLIEHYQEKPESMRLSVIAAALYNFGLQVVRLDKLVEHEHHGESGEEAASERKGIDNI